jgi:hypothetical protein
LNNKTAFFIASELLSQQLSQLLDCLEEFYSSASIEVAWLQQPERSFEDFICNWVDERALPLRTSHILKVKERLQTGSQTFVVTPNLLFFLEELIVVELTLIFEPSEGVTAKIILLILLGGLQSNFKFLLQAN